MTCSVIVSGKYFSEYSWDFICNCSVSSPPPKDPEPAPLKVMVNIKKSNNDEVAKVSSIFKTQLDQSKLSDPEQMRTGNEQQFQSLFVVSVNESSVWYYTYLITLFLTVPVTTEFPRIQPCSTLLLHVQNMLISLLFLSQSWGTMTVRTSDSVKILIAGCFADQPPLILHWFVLEINYPEVL